MDAGELVLGERVRKLDGSYGTVNALKSVHKPQGMYNLTVEGAHTFFVYSGPRNLDSEKGVLKV